MKERNKGYGFSQYRDRRDYRQICGILLRNGLEAYDGEINLGVEENMISNEFAVRLCLDHEVKCRNKVVKKELIIALRGEICFVKFTINPKEDDVEPGVVFGRSFGNGYRQKDKIKAKSDKTEHEMESVEKSKVNQSQQKSTQSKSKTELRSKKYDLDFEDISDIEGVGVPHFVCKMGKSSRTKRKQLEKYQLIYSDIGPSMSTRTPLTQEETEREALAINICERCSLLEEERPVIKNMAYSYKYKKILDEIFLDKMKLDGMNKEEEEAIIKFKGESLIEKEDPRAFVISIRLEGKINLNALAKIGLDINVMAYRVYKELGKEEVGVTTIIAKFLILDMPIDRDTPILVGRGFLHTCGGILDTIDNITSTFDGICHQIFRAAKTSLDTTKSDSSDDEEEYAIQRNKFRGPIYEPKPARYLNCNDPLDQSLGLQEVLNPFRKICVWKKVVSFLGSLHVALQHVEWKPDYT
nr:hypothetical protein [Tanacetum cinerariifolium]